MKAPALRWSVPRSLYPKEAVLAAAYRFADRAWFKVAQTPDGHWRVTARRRRAADGAGWKELADGFENELIHQALRLGAVAAGGKLRECIVLRALASAEGAGEAERSPGVDARLEARMDALSAAAAADPADDPLGILKEWSP